jgi:hypothetical protein
MGVSISAWSMGDTVDELVGWFDEWSDPASNDSKQEGRDKQDPSQVDAAGTSLYLDYTFHITTLVYSWFGFIVIMTGATIFGFVFMWPRELQGCDLSKVDEFYYREVNTLIRQEVDYPSCEKAVGEIFKLSDLDGSGFIDRCENAQFLYGMGNTEEYALMYNEVKTLPMVVQ